MKLEPSHAWAHYQIGTIYEAWGQQSKAVDSYARAFALDPQLAFPEVNPHIVENKLVTQAMLRAYRNDSAAAAGAQDLRRPGPHRDLLVPRPATAQEEKDQRPASPPRSRSAVPRLRRRPAASPEPPRGQAPGPGATVLREGDLDRGNPAGQAQPQGIGQPGGAGLQPAAAARAARVEPAGADDPGGARGSGRRLRRRRPARPGHHPAAGRRLLPSRASRARAGWASGSRRAQQGVGTAVEAPYDVEAEVGHVAVLHHVLLAFQAEQAGVAAGGHGLQADQVVAVDDLGADEAALDVGVDGAAASRARVPRRIVQARTSSSPTVKKEITPSRS